MTPNRIHKMKYLFSNQVALLALPLLAGMICLPSSARADNYVFSVNGNGFSGTGVLQLSNTGPFGASTITGITGTFTDSVSHFSGTISGGAASTSLPVGPPATDSTDTFFPAPAFTNSGFSYDDLFWVDGNSPDVCVDAPPIFQGGDFDIYGLAFNVTDGSNVYTVDLWSNGPIAGGYQLNDGSIATNPDGTAYAVDFTASPTPEPSSLVMLGSGVLGLAGVVRRKRIAWKTSSR